MKEIMNVIKSRRSIRSFSNEQIKQEELDVILEAGMYAPSAAGKQARYFTVIQDQQILDEISSEAKRVYRSMNVEFLQNLGSNERFDPFFHAPTVIVISGEINSIAPNSDCAVAAQNIMLAAEALQIGSCWISASAVITQTEEGKKIIEKLGLPEDYAPFNSIALGYKKTERHDVPPRREGVVNYIRNKQE
ncbi:MAG: nitroreductase family protein [Spirochaetaceae bacterium]|jgi:nitroreductase|nr:nitroreductase family protein [Spirochaetaceae bacterium]